MLDPVQSSESSTTQPFNQSAPRRATCGSREHGKGKGSELTFLPSATSRSAWITDGRPAQPSAFSRVSKGPRPSVRQPYRRTARAENCAKESQRRRSDQFQCWYDRDTKTKTTKRPLSLDRASSGNPRCCLSTPPKGLHQNSNENRRSKIGNTTAYLGSSRPSRRADRLSRPHPSGNQQTPCTRTHSTGPQNRAYSTETACGDDICHRASGKTSEGHQEILQACSREGGRTRCNPSCDEAFLHLVVGPGRDTDGQGRRNDGDRPPNTEARLPSFRPQLPRGCRSSNGQFRQFLGQARGIDCIATQPNLSAGPQVVVLIKYKWWARLGLNQRPLRCQRSALPLSYAPYVVGNIRWLFG